MKLREVRPGLTQVRVGFVNVFLIDAGSDGLILIDAGSPGAASSILEAIGTLHRAPEDVRLILVTHGHPDHAGSLAALKEATGAEVAMHPADANLVQRGHCFRKPFSASPGMINWLIYRTIIAGAPQQIEPVVVDRWIGEGDSFPFAGSIRTIHTPGHTVGHLCFLWEVDDGLLLAGDACMSIPRLRGSVAYEDRRQGMRSLARLAQLPFKAAVFGHGEPILDGASRKIAALPDVPSSPLPAKPGRPT